MKYETVYGQDVNGGLVLLRRAYVRSAKCEVAVFAVFAGRSQLERVAISDLSTRFAERLLPAIGRMGSPEEHLVSGLLCAEKLTQIKEFAGIVIIGSKTYVAACGGAHVFLYETVFGRGTLRRLDSDGVSLYEMKGELTMVATNRTAANKLSAPALEPDGDLSSGRRAMNLCARYGNGAAVIRITRGAEEEIGL